MVAAVAVVLAGLVAVMTAHVLARRTGLPSAIVLVAAGLVYGLLPGPNLRLDPQLVLVVVIPPLLYAAALDSSLVALRGSARDIAGLSVGLVLATALGVGAVVSAAVPAVPLAAAVALGAAVAPPDPVAALSVGRRAGLSPRLVTLVEGEGLLNDAAALTTLQVAVAASVSGSFSVGSAVLRFVLAAAGGAAAGLASGLVLGAVRRHLDDPLVENALSLGTPFAVYVVAEQAHVSGVLAVVVAGLWLGHHGPTLQSGTSRLQTGAVWRLVEFLLEGYVFLLIGQQLPAVVRGLRAYPAGTVATAGVLTVAVVLLLRPVWLLVTPRVAPAVRLPGRAGVVSRASALSGREVVALSWAGTRGVITLAAVFALPLTVDGGRPFPARDLLLFCAYLVVLVTLVGQGLTFAPLLRRLRLDSAAVGQALVRNQARTAAVEAALQRLSDLTAAEPALSPQAEPLRRVAEARRRRYAERVAMLSAVEDDVLPVSDTEQASLRLLHAMIDAERETLLTWRDTGRLPDASLRVLQRELDHQETLLPAPPSD